MPLSAHCHSLRPEKTSGWRTYFELTQRGSRAGHFLVVGPASVGRSEDIDNALRASQAAVRYLKEVPPHAPPVTLLEATARILNHEASRGGTELEFGCAVLDRDALWVHTKGRVRLVPLGGKDAPISAPRPESRAVRPEDRFFLGRLPGDEEAEAQEVVQGLERGGGADGGLVLQILETGTIHPVERPPVAKSPPPAPAGTFESVVQELQQSLRFPETKTPRTQPVEPAPKAETTASSTPPPAPSPKASTPGAPPSPGSAPTEKPAPPSEPPARDMPKLPPAPAPETTRPAAPKESAGPQESIPAERKKTEPPKEKPKEDRKEEKKEKDKEKEKEKEREEKKQQKQPGDEKKGEGKEEVKVPVLPPTVALEEEEAPLDSTPYAPEETRGILFWLGAVAALVALGALAVYLFVIRPGGHASGPEPSAAETETSPEGAAGTPAGVEPNLAWQDRFTDAVTSSPLLAGEMVVFGCRDGRVYALDRHTGRRVWAYAASEGFGSSPARSDEKILIGGYDAKLYALNAATGEEIWATPTGGRIVASPAVGEDLVFVGSYDRILYAVALADGSIRWQRDLGGVLWASPTLTEDGKMVLAAGLDGTVTALDPRSGRVHWRGETGGGIYSSPAVGEGRVYLGSEDGNLYAFTLADGSLAWKTDLGNKVDGSPAYSEGRIVVGTDGGDIVGLDAATGEVSWRVSTEGWVKSRPAIVGDVAWVTSYDGTLYGVRTDSGEILGRFDTNSSAYSSPAVLDGIAYFGTMDGRFLAVGLGSSSS